MVVRKFFLNCFFSRADKESDEPVDNTALNIASAEKNSLGLVFFSDLLACPSFLKNSLISGGISVRVPVVSLPNAIAMEASVSC